MKEITAFSPGHVTGFFQICDQPSNPLYKGSRGAGVSITSGVTTKVRVERASTSSLKIRINGNNTQSAEVSSSVVKKFLYQINSNYNVFVDHSVKVPIGSGFGSSGAGALSLALALNEAFGTGMSRVEAAQVAHVAEIECQTGLGSVISEIYGGLEIRVKPGAPGIGEVKKIPITDDHALACLNLGPIPTKTVLGNSNLRRQINDCGEKLVDEMMVQPTPSKFMKLSREFAEHVGLISENLRKVFRDTDNRELLCSMAMLGESVFSLIKRDVVEELLKVFQKHTIPNSTIIISEIDFKGARLL